VDGPQADEWRHAMDAEFNALLATGTFELVPAPPGVRPLPCKWVYKLKYTTDGSIERFKARLVAGGHRQRDGVDYTEVFAPVGKFDSLRNMLAITADQDLELQMVDISNAFLNGVLETPVYMLQPQGYEMGAAGTVCKLKKTLYGLKQAPKEWFLVLKKGLEAIGFKQSESDQAFWVFLSSTGITVYTLHWVDDLIMGSADAAQLKAMKARILARFKGRDLGSADAYLNVVIERDRRARTLKISQPRHAEGILARLDMTDAKPKSVPMSAAADNSRTSSDDTPLEMDQARLYSESVGGLLYLASVTRPDLAMPVSALARHLSSPCIRHWQLLKAVLRYLKGTRTLGIVYGTSKGALELYTDADYATCKDTRRSRSGFVFKMYGGAVSWSSKLQSVVAQSTAESEYIAGAHAARHAVWVRRLCADMGLLFDGPVRLQADNQAAIFMAANSADSARTKHIDVPFHFLRQVVAKGAIRMMHVSTDENPADMFTKPLGDVKFKKFRSMIGMG
jgi:hypothetical protein